jgi:hypothetical protein
MLIGDRLPKSQFTTNIIPSIENIKIFVTNVLTLFMNTTTFATNVKAITN